MGVPDDLAHDPLRSVGGNQRELETKAVFVVIEPPLPDRAYDEEQSDPVGPDDDDVRCAAITFGE